MRPKPASPNSWTPPSTAKSSSSAAAAADAEGKRKSSRLREAAVDNSEVISTFLGAGNDSQDKGVYKAMAGAMKYMIAYTFSVRLNDEADAEFDHTSNTGKTDTSEIKRVFKGAKPKSD